LTESDQNASFKFDCAHGTTDAPITIDSTGHFDQKGTYFVDGGPVTPGDARQYPATFTGTVSSVDQQSQMNLTVSYTSSDGTPVAQQYTLKYNQDGSVAQFCAL
jgi:hypothetical protein